MEYQIWMQLIQLLSYRSDLIETIKPFLQQLNNNHNNEKYSINEEKHIPFLNSLSNNQIEVLQGYQIIDKNIYTSRKITKELSSEPLNPDEEMVTNIIKGDRKDELQKLINERGIDTINPITRSFKEVQQMKVPIIIECIIQKAINCFKYLLINQIEDPLKTMQDQNPQKVYFNHQRIFLKRYEWDCMAVAIYFGAIEIIKMLEEKGIELGSNPAHIEAAIFSYRNGKAKEMINKMKENNENINEILKKGLFISAQNNNINAAYLLIKNGANINAKDFFYQIIIKIIKLQESNPLHFAIENKSRELGQILISKGADINAKDIIY